MSEPTPETAASMMGEDAMDDDAMTSLSGGVSAAESEEPSMEDILASIRKIIADDSDPVPLDGPDPSEASTAPLPTPAMAAPSATMPEQGPADLPDVAGQADLDADELDIEALLSDIQVAEPETPPQPVVAEDDGAAPVFTAASPAPGLDDDLSIPDLGIESNAPQSGPVGASVEDADDEMDRLMSEMLTEMDALPAEPVAQTAPNSESSAMDDGLITRDTSDADELDLVKSLMADLTDEDEHTAPDMLVTDATVLGDGDIVPDATISIDAPDDDIMGSILDMTLADEIATGPDAGPDTDDDADAVVVAAPDVESADAELRIPTPTADAAPGDDTPSLSDIAAAAEAGISASSPDSAGDDDDAVMAAVALLSGGASDATEADAEPDSPDRVTPKSTSDGTSAPDISDSHTHDTPELETSMPRAVRSDAILDDVTEEATMSAFAQLNQVVEDKAILTERGPRIGDLVQDALKPMLKEWLDENLQAIVERAVAKEVKRLSSGK